MHCNNFIKDLLLDYGDGKWQLSATLILIDTSRFQDRVLKYNTIHLYEMKEQFFFKSTHLHGYLQPISIYWWLIIAKIFNIALYLRNNEAATEAYNTTYHTPLGRHLR